MKILNSESFEINTQNDIVVIRKEVRACTAKIKFGIIDQTKVITAASELARNTLDYGGGGKMEMCTLEDDRKNPGIQLTFSDSGPGIADIERALTDGYTTGGGLGMGLSGSKRLMSEFKIESELGKGTRVTVTKWK